MILVMLGTQDNSFNRLLEQIEDCITSKLITEDVYVQIGKTKYTTNKMKILNPMPKEELEKYIQQSNYVITHGGVGSIMTALKCQKRVIAVPRLKKYEEHVNNHQLQIIEWYTKKGYILGIKDVSELKEAINKIEKFVPNKYENLTGNIIQIISDYINKN